jgi:hypothetical protein
VSSDFTVGALALADRRSNAVGAVRLTLLPEALEIELVRAAGFAEGFALGSVAEAVRFQVPYSAVRGLVRQGRTLMLTLDPAISSPHTRFALARFTEDPAEALARAWQARALARWASTLLPLPLGLLAAYLTPARLVSGSLGRASLAILATGLLWLGLRELLAFRTWGGPFSDQLRDDFELKLSRQLGVVQVDRGAARPTLGFRRIRPPLPAPAPQVEIPDLLVPRAPAHRAMPPAPTSAPSLRELVASPRALASLSSPSADRSPPDLASPSLDLGAALLDLASPSLADLASPLRDLSPPSLADLAAPPAPLPSAPPPALPLLEVPAQPRLRSAPPPAPPRWLAPRVLRPAALLVAASLGTVGVMLFLQRYAAPKAPPPAVPLLIKGVAAAVDRARTSAPPEEPDAEASPRPRCVCLRADSPLWKDGLPALSVLTYTSDDEAAAAVAPTADRSGRPRYDFDLAVVNNAARAQNDVRVTLTFARRSKAGKRVGATDRGLFWGGALGPGHAVKWHVKAPGSEYTMDTSVSGQLEKGGVLPAPAEAFVELMGSSRARALRVHAVTMLAYLGDPRARDAALSLGAQSPEEKALMARLLRASSPVRVCEITRTDDHVDACVFNASVEPKKGLQLRALPAAADAADAPEGPRYAIGGTIPVHEGVRVEVPVEGIDGEAEWEAISAEGP